VRVGFVLVWVEVSQKDLWECECSMVVAIVFIL
jgi:hypothetical protein